jgi:membrane protein DedA with SNARE-associated domain
MQEEKDKAITIKTFVYAISLMLCIGFSFGFGIKIADKLYLGEIFYWVLLISITIIGLILYTITRIEVGLYDQEKRIKELEQLICKKK